MKFHTKDIALSEADQTEIFRQTLSGIPLRQMMKNMNLDYLSFWEYQKRYPTFAEELNTFRKESCLILSDDLMHLSADLMKRDKLSVPMAMTAKLHSDNIARVLGYRDPATYGARIDHNVNITVDLKGALAAAETRLIKHTAPSIEAECTEIAPNEHIKDER